jgi:hypothetical protein
VSLPEVDEHWWRVLDDLAHGERVEHLEPLSRSLQSAECNTWYALSSCLARAGAPEADRERATRFREADAAERGAARLTRAAVRDGCPRARAGNQVAAPRPAHYAQQSGGAAGVGRRAPTTCRAVASSGHAAEAAARSDTSAARPSRINQTSRLRLHWFPTVDKAAAGGSRGVSELPAPLLPAQAAQVQQRKVWRVKPKSSPALRQRLRLLTHAGWISERGLNSPSRSPQWKALEA